MARGDRPPAPPASRPAAASPLSTALVVVLAAACGLSAANLYYPQPLLHTLAATFGTHSGTAGLVVTASQVGYAVGLALVVPVGDILSRRRIVPVVLLLTGGALGASALAPGIGVLIGLALLVGVGSVAAQMLVPLAASLADEQRRGQVVGTVMSGLLLGILLARTLSGLVAGATSWRVVYWAAAALVLALAALLSRVLPDERGRPRLGYGALLRSTVSLFLAEPVLRRRAAFGSLGFAAFSVLWTTIAFLLAGAPYHYGDIVIGLFGLAGAAGALCANVAGRWADHGWARVTTTGFTAAVLVSFLPLWLGRHSLAWLLVGIVVLDIGAQGLQVTNQSVVYALAGEARSRANASYMVMFFIGGAAGSAIAASVYEASGWTGACILGGVIGAVATVAALADARWPARAATGTPQTQPATARPS